jgi:hypothetical protein
MASKTKRDSDADIARLVDVLASDPERWWGIATDGDLHGLAGVSKSSVRGLLEGNPHVSMKEIRSEKWLFQYKP